MQVSEDFLSLLLDRITKVPDEKIRVDLEKQEITLLSTGDKENFDINPYKKQCLQNGYDDIDYLLNNLDRITAYEEKLK